MAVRKRYALAFRVQVRGSLEMAKILVLGGGGFIGLNLCDALLQGGHQVRVLDRGITNPRLAEAIDWQVGDFRDLSTLSRCLDEQDYVFHLISTTLPKTSNDDPIYDVESNLIGTLRILELCRGSSVKKLFFVSSGGTIYGNPDGVPIAESHPSRPLSSYGVTKLAIEKYLSLYKHLYGLPYTAFRLANPYGRYQSPASAQGAVAVFLGRALRGETIEIWGDGSVVRDYIYVADVVSALVSALDYEGPEEIFNLGSGLGVSLRQLVDAIADVVNHPVNVVYKPARSFDVPVNVLDVSRISASLKWGPRINLSEGLRLTRDFLLENQ